MITTLLRGFFDFCFIIEQMGLVLSVLLPFAVNFID